MTPDLAKVVWRKSTRSTGQNGNCVEVALTTRSVGVRDSKNATGPALAFPLASWRAFVAR